MSYRLWSLLEIMSFLIENKFFVGVVGIAVSSAALGYAMSRYRLAQAHSSQTKPSDIVADAAVKYLMKHAIREPLPLMRLREVRRSTSNWLTEIIPCKPHGGQVNLPHGGQVKLILRRIDRNVYFSHLDLRWTGTNLIPLGKLSSLPIQCGPLFMVWYIFGSYCFSICEPYCTFPFP